VSTFYLLPPRPLLGERFATYLSGLFPGLSWDASRWLELADALTAAAAERPDVYVIHREELPEGEDAERALRTDFGAEDGDEIIEVHAGARPGEVTAKRWLLRAA